MDIIQLYRDFSVDHVTEGNKHSRPGWVNTPCPFCRGNSGYHLGYNLNEDHFYCWRCGWKPIVKTVAALISVSERETEQIIKLYGLAIRRRTKEAANKIEFQLPSRCGPLERSHRKYLEGRNFDPEKLEAEWGLLGTSVVSKLKKGDGTPIDYRRRIVIPFRWNGETVSFDSRDITGKAMEKYLACPKERELLEHKRIVYGNQEKWEKTGLCVEGPTDVWRMGPRSFATSGIKFTPAQLRVIANSFKRVFVLYDEDPQAVIQARKLVKELRMRGVECKRIPITGDPGGMPQDEADYLVKQLTK